MKNLPLKTAVLFSLFAIQINAQVGIGTASPNPSAALDVAATNGGMLVPRVPLTSTSDTSTITSPALSLLVYNNGFAPNGYYYWSGAAWIQLTTGNADWSLTGNLGTSAGTNFIGTTDTQDIRFKTNSADRLNISHTNSGQLQSYAIGNAALPAYSFNGQTGTGVFGAATDLLGFSTAGTERIRIDNTGNVGIGTVPTASSILDMSTITNKAMEVPNVALLGTTTATISSPATGALVFNTATTTGTTAVYPGYYYWDGAAWNSMTVGGQSSTTYFSTSGIVLNTLSSTIYTVFTTPSITIPANCYVFISGDLGVQVGSTAANAYSIVDVALGVDGAGLVDSGYQRLYVVNTGLSTLATIRYASMSQTVSVTPGAHTFSIGAGLPGGTFGCTVGGNSTSVLQGELTVTIIKR